MTLLSVAGVVLLAAVTASAQNQAAQTPVSLSPQLRLLGDQLMDQSQPEAARVEIALELGEDADRGTLAFLAALLPGEPSSAVRRAIIGVISQSRLAETSAILRSLAESERGRDTAQFLDDQIQAREEAASEEFFRSAPAPPVEQAPAASDATRFFVIGDFGTSERGPNDMQEQVAVAMKRFHESQIARPAQFGVTVGDNFYPLGVNGAKDERWGHDWEAVYGNLGIRFFASLGNHDHYGGGTSTKGQIQRSSKSWRMAAPYYMVKAGVVDLFMIDTQKILGQQSQIEWLERVLNASTAAWKVVVGHHPVASGGKHGINGDLKDYRDKLLPLLRRYDAGLYLAGHDHDMQLLRIDGQYQAIVGSSGKDSRKVVALDESLFCSMSNGFGFVEASRDSLRMQFLRAPDAAAIYDCTLERDPSTQRITDRCMVKCQ